jgi:microcystin-dependent protein
VANWYMGEIRLFAFNYAPEDWAMCNGQLLSVANNQTLFNLIGPTYGGDGVNTFALPNLQGSVAVHQGEGPGGTTFDIGQTGGAYSETLSEEQLPSHTHTVAARSQPGTSTHASNHVPAATTADAYGVVPDTTMSAEMIEPTGGGEAVSTMPPYLTLNYCIALTGIYPTED